ncbi:MULTISPECIES: hypothetical protein [unclassified Colwellia]|uniref:hypothetical protein n=1 Tax=unclassified Colwellia TaxID=196834 RepID=UPI0015F4A449|nr:MULTISPECIES: hypothetical protein [unclassified Colwellia]MBA6230759.1 hypothetical protein [Colwellia sp. MB02u-7]MBA6234690.1 hypothetical protein [Colwellia sp. MB02u-11]MBA6301244.1 hypothetical protein [Colwellia sp. MB3u-22]MBA6305271.1 hypothetical protein [Colwellia sp. MB02u-14]MBA6313020.1 hypothetical protein [Colwellia sp. MB3u-64]
MSEDKKVTSEQAFEKWLDRSDSLEDSFKETKNQKVRSNESAKEERIWQKRLKTAIAIEHQESLQAKQNVPEWDRAAAFESDEVSWWQWGGLPAMSMAFSVFAVVLVLFKVEFVMNDNGMLLTFGDKQPSGYSQAEIETLVNAKVDQKLQLFASEQQVVLANYAADIKVKQQDNNLQLASYLMGASRQERKEDIGDFIQYINDQRADDSLDNKIKFQQLESVINYQSLQKQNINYQPNNTNNLNSDGLGLTTKPVSWTSKE